LEVLTGISISPGLLRSTKKEEGEKGEGGKGREKEKKKKREKREVYLAF
jgi:hypothetical protein